VIGKLTGTFDGVTPNGAAIVSVGGVGYAVYITASLLLDIKARHITDTTLFIHTVVREDAIDLYGFEGIDELAFFKQLLSVSAIGPKTALGILNVADTNTLKHSIAAGDASVLTKVYGIGKKSAERIVVELRDKLVPEHGVELVAGSERDVIEALMALGYSAQESRKALSQVDKKVEGTKERLAAALKQLGSASL
jgi:Holliday junction DNA helicase RuvA